MKNSINKPKQITYAAETTITAEIEKIYILKDYKGRIALFNEINEKPLEIYNIFTESLPKNDAELLKNGLKVTSSELNDVLSDYIS